MAEMHVYEDRRGDTGPEWGVFERFCAFCGRQLAIVAKIDAEPPAVCRMCDPALYREPVAVEDGVLTVRIGSKDDC